MPDFTHLHVHTQFSLLDGAAGIKDLMKKAQADGMKAMALTDHGNMFGAFNFVAEANKYNIKPIIGCEFYLVEHRHKKSFTKENGDHRYHQLLLAKNEEGYKNLSKLCSLGYIDGLYSKWPRIDKELVLQYHKGIIATTCCIGAEVPQAILRKSEEEAETVFKFWLDIFEEDYYIELQRHNLKDIDGSGKSQEDVNQILLKWAKKYNVKTIATNDSHYVNREDWTAHDILLCVNTGELQSTPVGDGRGFRFGFPNNEFFFKTKAEMNEVFKDIPEAIDNTGEIVDKCFMPNLNRNILLPNFKLPDGFVSEDDYLAHLTFKGAEKRYIDLTPELTERLEYELRIIKTMGFAGYFLIVQDFIAAGKNLGVAVGPGRGSAAGSAVAYCIGITNIDPVKYNLLFERFLNPERVSMPDIDIDFDDEGRQKVIDYVVDKYGRNQVAQIITFGTMAARSSIKDVARTLDLPLPEANYLAKLVPEAPGTTLSKAYAEVNELKTLKNGKDQKAKVLELAERLEGSVRNTGIHAAGVIIAPDDITNYIPVSTSKESDLLVTQFDGKVIEQAGMLKMDFLGLKTLSIIKDAIALIAKNHNTAIDIDEIPLDDPKTFELYQRGDTVGTFQFESDGMRNYLRQLVPTDIEDLIAMNALYRPGPMDFIPNFIARKAGKEKVEYPHALLEGILKNTYGIMVYQEQIMQAAQIMAGYSLGGADLLRRAMGKKDKEKMAKEKVKFVEGAMKLHNVPEAKATEVFAIMEKFAEYGFNRSHSAAYSVVAYQTAWLKANYPAEYMASVLTHSMNSIEKIAFFMDECKKQEIQVLGPDINESAMYFDVNKEGKIRFGLGAIKGTGEAAVEAIIAERNANGPFTDIFEFAERVTLRAVNKKTFETLALSGAFDCFEGIHRAQYFNMENEGGTLLEKAIRYGSAAQTSRSSMQVSLFGGSGNSELVRPKIAECEPWSSLELLKREKEVVGFYISGHPLDTYRIEMEYFTNIQIADYMPIVGKTALFGGVITKVTVRADKRGNPFAIFAVEDYSGNTELRLFSEAYLKFKGFLVEGTIVLIKAAGKTRYGAESEADTEVQDISLLSEAHQKFTKSITLKLNLKDITRSFTEDLSHVINLHRDNKNGCAVKIEISDPAEKTLDIKTNSRIRLRPSNELLAELKSFRGVTVGLN